MSLHILNNQHISPPTLPSEFSYDSSSQPTVNNQPIYDFPHFGVSSQSHMILQATHCEMSLHIDILNNWLILFSPLRSEFSYDDSSTPTGRDPPPTPWPVFTGWALLIVHCTATANVSSL